VQVAPILDDLKTITVQFKLVEPRVAGGHKLWVLALHFLFLIF
jgi:hypothetical protein